MTIHQGTLHYNVLGTLVISTFDRCIQKQTSKKTYLYIPVYTQRKRVRWSHDQKAHPPPHPTHTPASCSSSQLPTLPPSPVPPIPPCWAFSPSPSDVPFALDSTPPLPLSLTPPDADHDGWRSLAPLAKPPNGLDHPSSFPLMLACGKWLLVDAGAALVLARNRNHPVAATPPATLETKAAT